MFVARLFKHLYCLSTAGIIVNDTIIGDPLYAAPFQPDRTSLCYEVHGQPNQFFNLVSDTCTNVNAHYSPMNVPENGNIISQIGVYAVGLAETACYTVLVNLDCSYEFNGEPVTEITRMDGIYVRQYPNRVRISVPNCENINLVMWVTCQNLNGQQMIRYDISRGLNLRPTSHGLLGTFGIYKL